MYICNSCGLIFESPKTIREYHNELDDNPYEEYEACPYCGCSDFDQSYRCDLCGEYTGWHYVKLKDGTVACSDCYETF